MSETAIWFGAWAQALTCCMSMASLIVSIIALASSPSNIIPDYRLQGECFQFKQSDGLWGNEICLTDFYNLTLERVGDNLKFSGPAIGEFYTGSIVGPEGRSIVGPTGEKGEPGNCSHITCMNKGNSTNCCGSDCARCQPGTECHRGSCVILVSCQNYQSKCLHHTRSNVNFNDCSAQCKLLFQEVENMQIWVPLSSSEAVYVKNTYISQYQLSSTWINVTSNSASWICGGNICGYTNWNSYEPDTGDVCVLLSFAYLKWDGYPSRFSYYSDCICESSST